MKTLILLLLITLPVCAQDSLSPVDAARTKIAKEKYEQKVAYAKSLLEQKENLEKELSEVNAKLAKIDRGEEVKIPNNSNNYSGQVVYTGGTGNLTLCCITGQQ